MANERSSKIKIGDKEYEILLTTKAVKELAKKKGGLDKLNEGNILKDANGESIDFLVWFITLLINQPIEIHNLKNPNDKKDLVKEEEIELLTTPDDLAEIADKIKETINNGVKRNIVSEPGKNVQGE